MGPIIFFLNNKVVDNSFSKNSSRGSISHRKTGVNNSYHGAAGDVYDFKINLKLQNGTVYSGQFDPKTQNKEGFGIQIWPDGSKYVG